jgi:hypothetical protein
VATFLTDLVAELESIDFAHAPDRRSVHIRATRRRSRGRNDLARIVVLRILLVGVADDVLGEPMRSLFGVLLSDIAAYSPQLAFLAINSSPV